MPIGISFYTFQALSYVIDVYRREVPPPARSVFAGAVRLHVPAADCRPDRTLTTMSTLQLAVRNASFTAVFRGHQPLSVQSQQKVLLSNVFAQIADGVFKYAPNELSAAGAWMGAIGVRCADLLRFLRLLGYGDRSRPKCSASSSSKLQLSVHPASRSPSSGAAGISSLSTWFRDYVYIPLGGNQCSPARHIFNLLAVWTLDRLLARC